MGQIIGWLIGIFALMLMSRGCDGTKQIRTDETPDQSAIESNYRSDEQTPIEEEDNAASLSAEEKLFLLTGEKIDPVGNP